MTAPKATAINNKSLLSKKTDPLRESKAARVQKPVDKSIRSFDFDGAGTYHLTHDEITADVPFTARYDPESRSLQVRSESFTGSAGSISFGSLNLGSMFGFSNLFGAVGPGSRTFINGVEYVNQRQADGRTIMVPKGSLPAPAAAAAEDEKKKTRYSFAENKMTVASLRRLTAGGSVHVVVDAADKWLPKDADVSLRVSGPAQIDLGKSPHTMGAVTVRSSGAAAVNGGGNVCKQLIAESSGASRISGFHGLEDVDASASGASSVSVSAAKGAASTKDRSGVASVDVFTL